MQTAFAGVQSQVAFVNRTVQSVTIPPQPYDVVFSPNTVLNSATEYFIEVFTRSVAFPPNFGGSVGRCITPPGTTQTFTINQNGKQIGTMTILNTGAFSFSTLASASTGYNAGDYLSLTNQSGADNSMVFQVTFAGTR